MSEERALTAVLVTALLVIVVGVVEVVRSDQISGVILGVLGISLILARRAALKSLSFPIPGFGDFKLEAAQTVPSTTVGENVKPLPAPQIWAMPDLAALFRRRAELSPMIVRDLSSAVVALSGFVFTSGNMTYRVTTLSSGDTALYRTLSTEEVHGLRLGEGVAGSAFILMALLPEGHLRLRGS